METVFTHNPTTKSLSEIGISEINETDYFARVNNQENHELHEVSITILLDLNAYFSFTKNSSEVVRIENLLQENGYFAAGFNE